MENFVDKEYKIHLTVAKAGLLYLLQLADTPVVPFTMKRYDNVIQRGLASLKMTMIKDYGIEKAEAYKRMFDYFIQNFPNRDACQNISPILWQCYISEHIFITFNLLLKPLFNKNIIPMALHFLYDLLNKLVCCEFEFT